jgi:limonene-1,2-epoxide hydrolase
MFIASIEAKDLDYALAYLDRDIVYDNVPMQAVHGVDAVRAALAPFLDRCSQIEWIIRREAAADDVVFNERLDRFRIDGRWIEVAVSGVWEVRDGVIFLWRDYFDRAEFQRQMS